MARRLTNQGLGSPTTEEAEMWNGAGEGQRIALIIHSLVLLLGGFVGEARGNTGARPIPMPDDLVWVCAYSDWETRCFDTIFESPVLLDCQNGRPLTEYEGGSGTMVLWDAVGEPHVYHYGSRSWNQNGGPGALAAIKLFPEDGVEFPPHKGGFEGMWCRMYVRE